MLQNIVSWLSPGNSSHPSSSQELAEIFGTSDDEDDDFPFNLNPNLNNTFADIGLPSGDSKKFDGSLLTEQDSGLFLGSIQEPLGIEALSDPDKTLNFNKEISAAETAGSERVKEETDKGVNEESGEEVKEKANGDTENAGTSSSKLYGLYRVHV